MPHPLESKKTGKEQVEPRITKRTCAKGVWLKKKNPVPKWRRKGNLLLKELLFRIYRKGP